MVSSMGRNYIYNVSHDKNGMPLMSLVGELVKCKDCMYYNAETHGCKRNPSVEGWLKDDFCSYGERKDNE